MTTKLSAADHVEIGRTLALFGHVADNWHTDGWHTHAPAADFRDDGLGLVFTDDVVFEFTRSGRVLQGIGAVREFLRTLPPDTPDHQTQDIVVLAEGDGTVRALSRYLAILPDGTVTNGEYTDVLVRLEEGWRIRSRRSIHRYPLATAPASTAPGAAGRDVTVRDEAWRPTAERLPDLLG